MAKPKKSEPDVVYPVSDRYLSIYANWQDFVTEKVPAAKYPLMNREYLK